MKKVLCAMCFVLCVVVVKAQERATFSLQSDSGYVNVYDDTLFLGSAPLDSVALLTGKHILRYVHGSERNWYHPPVVETVTVVTGQHLVRTVSLPSYEYQPIVLSQSWLAGIANDTLQGIPTKALEGKTVSNNTPLYLTTAGAVLSGAVAAYFKIQADNYYTKYQYSGDESELDKVKRNDTISGVALAVCEINLAALTYFLLSR